MSSCDFLDIYFLKIFSSATNSAKNVTAKIEKVIITDDDGMLLTAAFVGINPSIAHGWRPTSATIHPASEHIHTTGIVANAMIGTQRFWVSRWVRFFL
jgi:hypothetical protein